MAQQHRSDILWTVSYLSRNLTTWNVACDKRLHRLVSYIWSHLSKELISHIGDMPEDIVLLCFVDASFAGDLEDSKSTSGCFTVLAGPNTWCPVGWFCKKQTAVAHSSTEAEIIALDAGVRLEALPILHLYSLKD